MKVFGYNVFWICMKKNLFLVYLNSGGFRICWNGGLKGWGLRVVLSVLVGLIKVGFEVFGFLEVFKLFLSYFCYIWYIIRLLNNNKNWFFCSFIIF